MVDMTDFNFEWDDSIKVNDEIKEKIKEDIYRAKVEIERTTQDKEKVEEKRRKLKEVKKLKELFNKHITIWDYAANNAIGEEQDNKDYLARAIDAINANIRAKEDFIKKNKNDIRTTVFTIKRICLENVSEILYKAEIKAFKNKAAYILYINDLSITDKKKHTSYEVNFYSQNNLKWFVKKT